MLALRTMLSSRLLLGMAALTLAACETVSTPEPDATTGADAGDAGNVDARATCTHDSECSDDSFCNGMERCRPMEAGADARGCVASGSPCAAGQSCDEVASACRTICVVTEDADGDGAAAMECGGTDCDDADANRFPGNAEVCDATHDEDCDPLTIGPRDADSDGVIDAACCNVSVGATPICGLDCNDAQASVHPSAGEICNDQDDDCDGATDEGVQRTFWPDTDHDSWGDGTVEPTRACSPSAGLVENALDCDDASALVSPGRGDTCNGVDDDCDTMIDEAATSVPECATRYGSPSHTSWSCVAGVCTVGCDAVHADCDGDPSNGCEADVTTDVQNCGSCGTFCGIGGECLSGTCDEVVDIEVGESFTCAVRGPSGRVLCWGDNRVGELGNGHLTSSSTPTLVSDIEGVTQLALQRGPLTTGEAPPAFACARTPETVVCWGGQTHGQLGDGRGMGFRGTPGAVIGVPRFLLTDDGPAEVDSLAVGTFHACVGQGPLTSGTQQYGADCWGRNQAGQIVAAGATDYAVATNVLSYASGRTVVDVAAGRDITCAIYSGFSASAGRLRCWGSTAATFSGIYYDEVDAAESYACVRRGGQVYCLGTQPNGELGVGDTTARTTPTLVPGITDATQVVLGPTTACVIHADATVSCWGSRRAGLFGNGDWSTTPSLTPMAATGLTGVVDLSLSSEHACALLASGDVYCWGFNSSGQLGRPSTMPVQTYTPMLVPNL